MTKKVLFVCDDQKTLSVLEKGLEKYAKVFSALLANDEAVAKELLGEKTISLVVADVTMSQTDQHAFLTHLKENYPDIQLVLLADENPPENDMSILEKATAGHINRPFSADDLAKKIIVALKNEADGGILHGTAPGTFLQLVEMEQKTCTIRLNDEATGDQGVLFFLEGELLDARVKTMRGRDAAYKILAWNEATLAIQESCPIRENKVQADLQALLLEAMRLKDEKEIEQEDKMTQEEIDEFITSRREEEDIDLEDKMTQEEIDEYIISSREDEEHPEITVELDEDASRNERAAFVGIDEPEKPRKEKISSQDISPVPPRGETVVPYTMADNILGVLLDLKESFFESSFVKYALRMLALSTMVVMAGIIFLFMTLETEKDLMNRIDQTRAAIRVQQEALHDLDNEIEELYILKEKSIKNNESQVAIMDLDLKIAELDEKKDKIQTESNIRQKILEQWQIKLEAMKRKSLFDRLMEHANAYLSPNSQPMDGLVNPS